MTTGKAWVLGSDPSYRESGYVATSRGREANRLYVVAGCQDPAGDEATPTASSRRPPTLWLP